MNNLLFYRGQLPTFSFLNSLFWESSQAGTENERQKILQHESVHFAQKHTWDILYLELFTLFFWFHPAFYFYKKALTSTHEFIADAEVIRPTDQQEYAMLLVTQFFQGMNLSIGHYFNKSLTLKRMKMLPKNHFRPNRLKQILALPLIAVLFFLVSARNNSVAEVMEDPDAAVSALSESLIQPEPELQDKASAGQSTKPSQGENVLMATQFPGGKPAFKDFLTTYTNYPVDVLKKKMTGQATIQVTIDEQGQVGNFKTLHADNAFFEVEAIRALRNKPNWKPATINGKATSTTLAFPFIFTMKSNKQSPALKLPVSKTRFVLQDVTLVVGYDQLIAGKTVGQKAIPASQMASQDTLYPRDNVVFTSVEQQPSFPGGDMELNNFIRKNLKYPAEALTKGKEGLVVVQFVVDRNGKIFDPEVVKSLGYGTDEEALRVVKLLPDFRPAKQNGKPVEFRYTLPFRFSSELKDRTQEKSTSQDAIDKIPSASPYCEPGFRFYKNGQLIHLDKTKATGKITVTYEREAGCPGERFRIESVRYSLERDDNKIAGMTVKGDTGDLTNLLSRSKPGDQLILHVEGKIVPGKDGKASSPFQAKGLVKTK